MSIVCLGNNYILHKSISVLYHNLLQLHKYSY